MAEVITPAAMIFTLLGYDAVRSQERLPARVFIASLERAGVAERTVRIALDGMVGRGYFVREKVGREAMFRMTDDARAIIQQNAVHVAESIEDVHSSAEWTLLSFSIPETDRSHRHRLRSQLLWSGFGPLRDGLWIAYGERDVRQIIEEIGVDEYVTAFAGHPIFGIAEDIVRRVWDLEQFRRRFIDFLESWDGPGRHPDAADTLGQDLHLVTEWRHIRRDTPRLPMELIPADWPASACQALFRARHAEFAAAAHRELDDIILGRERH